MLRDRVKADKVGPINFLFLFSVNVLAALCLPKILSS